MRRLLFLLFLILPSLVSAQQMSRDAVIDQTIATLGRVVTFSGVAISPDGSRVAYIERGAIGEQSQLFVAPVTGGAAVPVTIQTTTTDEQRLRSWDPAWSPDGKQVAFLSTASGRQALYVASADAKSIKSVTTTAGSYQSPKWSPDGRKIAVLLVENSTRRQGATEAMATPTGDVGASFEEQRIAIVDVATKKLEFATPGDLYVYDFDWSPDGRSLVAEAAHGSGEANYWIAKLYRFDLGDQVGRVIHTPKLQIANPRWSPDGKSIAFLEGLMSDEGSNGGDVFIVPAAGGEARNLTAGMPATPTSLDWAPDSKSILIGEQTGGRAALARVFMDRVEQLWSGEEKVSVTYPVGASFARDGVTSAVVRQSFTRPPEVWAGPVGAWKQITKRNDSVQPMWGEARDITWTNDGFREQGWLLAPRNVDPSKRLPMIVDVHGGPSSGYTPSWPNLNLAILPANGYYVFLPNPRGSFGQGEAFTQANVKDFGRGDLRDILAGTEAAIASAPIDKDRIGISGWSYGGYMTMWAVTQTQRFKAAFAGAGISNWQSYYGQNQIDEWMIPFFGASVYEDPWIYRRSSPIEYITNVKTPTLIIVGESDGEVPAAQSFEFYRALKTLGVKSKLVVYPGEGHRIAKPEHVRDIARRVVGWFDEYL